MKVRVPNILNGINGLMLLALGTDRLCGFGAVELVLGILLLVWFCVRAALDAFDGVADAIEGESLP